MRRLLVLALAGAALAASGCTLGRPADPVVLKGSQLTALQDVPAGDVVAFRWVQGWDQVPVQVDERKSIDLEHVYGHTDPRGFATVVYADPDTFTGADPDPDLDADDEVAFMSKDVGLEAPSGTAPPAGVVPGSGVKLHVQTAGGQVEHEAWLYLFRRSGTLSPAAGEDYVQYDFDLLSGDYKATYQTAAGPNPEDTTVSTPYYEEHFSDRWLKDGLRVKAGAASEADILDRAKVRLIPGQCGRSEDTFDSGEGAFIANIDGPVRAIRSYIGANSGPRTQRDHIFYEQREDVRTFLRVHDLPGVLDFHDYSAAAIGMSYRNNVSGQGVTIDGNPETPPAGNLTWESVDGPQGGLSIVHTVTTDIPGFASTSYYLDDSTPAEAQCTGDAAAIGASGPWINQPIPNTDPVVQVSRILRSVRTIYFEPPGAADGVARSRDVASPFLVTPSAP